MMRHRKEQPISRKVKFSHESIVYFLSTQHENKLPPSLSSTSTCAGVVSSTRLPLSACELQFSLLENWPRRHTELTTSSRTTRRVELSVATGSTSQSSGYFLYIERLQVEKNRHDIFVERIHA